VLPSEFGVNLFYGTSCGEEYNPTVTFMLRLVRQEVTDYGATWTVVAKKLAPAQEFQNFLHLFGVEAAQRNQMPFSF
jgi:p190-A and -B Rho GAPs FF domain